MVKYLSAITLALFSVAAVAQNSAPVAQQPAQSKAEVKQVAQATQTQEELVVEESAAPGSAAGGVGATGVTAPVVVGVTGAVALAAIIASSSGGSSSSHH